MNDEVKAAYIASFNKYDVGNDSLLALLGEELFTSPASTMTHLHNAFNGGLVDHLLRVAKYAVHINNFLPPLLKQNMNSVMRVALLSEIGKVGAYRPCTSEWHRKNQGKMYELIDDNVTLHVGERSIYYINQAGIQLLEKEFQAILGHDKPSDDIMKKWHGEVITVILRMAIELAIIEEKSERRSKNEKRS